MVRITSRIFLILLPMLGSACASFPSIWWSDIEPATSRTVRGVAALRDENALFDELDRRCETAERDAQVLGRFWSAALMAVTGTTCVTGLCSGATAAISTGAAAFPYQSVQLPIRTVPAGAALDSAKVIPVVAAVIAALAAVSAGAVAAVFGILSASDRVNHYFGIMSRVRAARAGARRFWLGDETREKALDQLSAGCSGEMYREGASGKPADGKIGEFFSSLQKQKVALEAERVSGVAGDQVKKTALLKRVDEALTKRNLYMTHPAGLASDIRSLNAGTFGDEPALAADGPKVTGSPVGDLGSCKFTAANFPTQIPHNAMGPELQCRLPDGKTRYQVRATGPVKVGESGGAGGAGPYWIVLELRGGTCTSNDRRELVTGPSAGYAFDLMTTGCEAIDGIGRAQVWAARCTGGRDSTCVLGQGFSVEIIPVQ